MEAQTAITIGKSEVSPIFFRNQPVLTLAMVDKIHERPEGTARKRYNDNKGRMLAGEDYFVRNSDEAKELGITAPRGIVLLTESGYLLLVKSFTDELAWQIQRQLVKAYFRAGGMNDLRIENHRTKFAHNHDDGLSEEQAEVLRLMLKEVADKLPKEKQRAFMVRGWSKLKSHFKVSYRMIPHHEHTEAVSILARHIAEETCTTPITQKTARYLMWFNDNGEQQFKPIPMEACVMTPEQMINAIATPNGVSVEPEKLFEFVVKMLGVLQQSYGYVKAKAESAKTPMLV